MKKLLLVCWVIIPVLVLGQPLSVSSNYTPESLVSEVLIAPDCLTEISNVSWKNSSQFGPNNSIGYFSNTNTSFPFTEGVVLTSGNIAQIPGYTTVDLSSGANTWMGDADINTVMQQAGFTMNSINASALEFDFKTFKNNFSLDFIFSSEEYGTYQCHAKDAMAILLTNTVTGQTQNIAVLPTTNIPVSIPTIRDNAYNSVCSSENSTYFDIINGCVGPVCPATNFNGQTVVLTAQANITPNTLYHIKIVVADSQDNRFDSAIFIKKFSLDENILGSDYLIANQTALCVGETLELLSNLPSDQFTFKWYQNNALLPETTSSLTISNAGTYKLEYTNINTGCTFTDEILIEYYPEMPINNPIDLSVCDTGATDYEFDLTINTPIILGDLNPDDYTISYHASLSDAQSNSNPIVTSYTASNNTTIYVRIEELATGCFIYKTFNLLALPAPMAVQPPDMESCETVHGSGVGMFLLMSQDSIIKGGITGLGVHYYTSLTDAENDTNAIPNPDWYPSGNAVIYARLYRLANTACYSTTSFNLIVNPKADVTSLPDIEQCEPYVLEVLTIGEYHTLPGGGGDILSPGDVVNNTQTIYIFNPNPDYPQCYGESEFVVNILDPEDMDFEDITLCEPYVVPDLIFGDFYDAPGGTGNIIPAGTLIEETQTIYYFYQSPTDPNCLVDDSFLITILEEVPITILPNIISCDPYQLPVISDGSYYTQANAQGTQLFPGDWINSDTTIYIYNNPTDYPLCAEETSFFVNILTPDELPQSLSACSFYNLPPSTIGNYYTEPNGGGTLIPYNTSITTTQTLYFLANVNAGVNCTEDYSFTITILPALPIDILEDIITCTPYPLPVLTNGNYFTGPNGTGTMLFANQFINETQTIYIYNSNDTANCASQSYFTVTFPTIPTDVTECGSYHLPPLAVGNYYTEANGQGTLLPTGYEVTETQIIYYYAEVNYQTNCTANSSFTVTINPIPVIDFPEVINVCDQYTIPAIENGQFYPSSGGIGIPYTTGQIIDKDTVLYLYLTSNTIPACHNEKMITINIDRPVLEERNDIITCEKYILTHLSIGNYYTEPNGQGTILSAGHEVTHTQTFYVYAKSSLVEDCFSETSFNVEIINVLEPFDNVHSCGTYHLPNLPFGNYYTGSNQTGTLLQPNDPITTTTPIYVYAQSGDRITCTEEEQFTVYVYNQPIVDVLPDQFSCETYQLPHITNGQYYTQPMGGGQQLPENTIITQSQTIYIFNQNPLAPQCYDQSFFQVTVYNALTPNITGGVLCKNVQGFYENNILLNTELPTLEYTFEWYKDGVLLPYSSNTLYVNQPGLYEVVATQKISGCKSEKVVALVEESSKPFSATFTIQNPFETYQNITIHVQGEGQYSYSLDGGAWQSESTFTNVTAGYHQVEIKDQKNCGSLLKTISTLSYPPYFTPNADGQNDLWHIIGRQFFPGMQVYIYDRYGKLIKQLTSTDTGWDGTYNHNPDFANDYWFKVTYVQDGVEHEFKSHFSLIR